MLRIRIVSTVAATAIVFVLAVNGAAAQTASADQPGKPLSLLQLIKQTAATPPAAHASSANTAAKMTKIKKIASKKHNKVAAAQDVDSSADTAQSSASADAWLAASTTPANNEQAVKSDNAQSGNGQPDNGQLDLGPLPSSIQVGGQTVQVASADQVNEIDLAADNTQLAESTAPPSDRTDIMAAANAMANAMPASPAALVAPVRADAGQTAQTASDQNATTVGSASWIAQVLAALGGAIAAGAVAWFLLGTGPVRTYG